MYYIVIGLMLNLCCTFVFAISFVYSNYSASSVAFTLCEMLYVCTCFVSSLICIVDHEQFSAF